MKCGDLGHPSLSGHESHHLQLEGRHCNIWEFCGNALMTSPQALQSFSHVRKFKMFCSLGNAGSNFWKLERVPISMELTESSTISFCGFWQTTDALLQQHTNQQLLGLFRFRQDNNQRKNGVFTKVTAVLQ